MKKFISLILPLFLLFAVSPTASAENKAQRATVYITVTDITNADEPINTLLKRQPLTVEYRELEKELTGIECIDGLTYMHAIVALHQQLYGESWQSYLMLTEDGETHIFMGKSIDSIMYKNGEDIFSLPQNVPLASGDEINISLYNAGHPQKVATFSEAVIRGIARGEEVNLRLYEHYESPTAKNPIEGAEITNAEGEYILNAGNELITTEADGSFTVAFTEPGEYQVSIMPQIDYYYDENGGTTIVEYIPEEVTYTAEKEYGKIMSYEEAARQEPLIAALLADGAFLTEGKCGIMFTCDCGWVSEGEVWDGVHTCEHTYEYTVTELKRVETFIPGEATQQIEYTPPYCIIEVTDNLVIKESSVGFGAENDSVFVSLKNADINEGVCICAAYSGNTYIGMQEKELAENMSFAFSKGADRFKLMFWDSIEGMQGIANACEVK